MDKEVEEWLSFFPHLDRQQVREEMENCPYNANVQIMIGVTLDEAIELVKAEVIHIHEAKGGLVDNFNGSGGLLEVNFKDVMICTKNPDLKTTPYDAARYSPSGSLYLDTELTYSIDSIFGNLPWSTWEANVSPASKKDMGKVQKIEFIGEGGEPVFSELMPEFDRHERIQQRIKMLHEEQPQKIIGTVEKDIDHV